MYYGWRVGAGCFVAGSFTRGFGVYGASVYLSQITVSPGWPVVLAIWQLSPATRCPTGPRARLRTAAFVTAGQIDRAASRSASGQSCPHRPAGTAIRAHRVRSEDGWW